MFVLLDVVTLALVRNAPARDRDHMFRQVLNDLEEETFLVNFCLLVLSAAKTNKPNRQSCLWQDVAISAVSKNTS